MCKLDTVCGLIHKNTYINIHRQILCLYKKKLHQNDAIFVHVMGNEISPNWMCWLTVGSKIFRAFAIILVIFLSFHCQFVSSYACYKDYKIYRSCLEKYSFHKTALDMCFLTRIISRAQIIILPTVKRKIKYFLWRYNMQILRLHI